MRLVKKLFWYISLFLVLSAVIPPTLFAQASRIIRVGAFDNYPVIFKDTDGKYKGLYVDLLTEIGRQENIEFEYVAGTWSDGLERIKSGEVDMLTSVGYSNERSTFMDYTKTPVLKVWGEVYSLPSANIKGVLDLANKKVAIMKNDINATNFKNLATKFGVNCQYVELDNYASVFDSVKNGTVDSGVAGVTFGLANYKKYNLISTGIIFDPIDLYFTVTKVKNHDLLDILDKHLSSWEGQNDSVYSQSKLKWLAGGIGQTVSYVPSWLTWVLIVFVLIVLLSFVFVIVLRHQVSIMTTKLLEEAKEEKENEKKWQLLFESSRDALMTLDPPDWKFSSGNQSALKLFGVNDLEKFKSYSLSDLSPEKQPDGRLSSEVSSEVINKAIQDGSNYFEWTCRRIGGEEFVATVLLTLIKFSGKEFLQATVRDVTERYRIEKELAESRAVLQSKIVELEKFKNLSVGRELKMIELKKKLRNSEK